MRYQDSAQQSSIQHPLLINNSRPQTQKYRQLLSQMEEESFYDDSLFFDKNNIFSLVNPPPKRIKTIYHKILLSNKNDPLHPSSYRKNQSNQKTHSQNRGMKILLPEKQNNSQIKISMNHYDFGKGEILSNIRDKLRDKSQSGSKDRKVFFKNLLQKFSQSAENDNSIHYKQKIHLFKKIFEHYKIKPQQKEHFNDLFRKISQKQVQRMYPQVKISTKINLEQRKNNNSVNEKRDPSPQQLNLRIKQKAIRTSYQRKRIEENNLSQILSIQTRKPKSDSMTKTNTQFFNKQKLEIDQLEKQLSSRKINYKSLQEEFQLNSYPEYSQKRAKVQDKKLNINLNQINKQQTPIDIKLQKFREFLFAINFSNHIFVPLEVDKYPTTFKIFIGRGNNSNLIRSVFKKRFWFQITKNINQAHLVWTQLKQQSIFKQQKDKKYLLTEEKSPKKQKSGHKKLISIQKLNAQQMQQSFQKHHFLTEQITKMQQISYESGKIQEQNSMDLKSLKMKKNQDFSKFISVGSQRLHRSQKKDEKKQKQAGLNENIIRLKKYPQILLLKNVTSTSSNPLSRVLCSTQMNQYEKLYSKFIKNPFKLPERKIPTFHQRKSDVLYNPNGFIMKEEEKKTSVIHNHLPFNGILGNKKAMFYILREYCDATQKNLNSIVPLTFHIKHGLKDQQYKRFMQEFEVRKKKKKINYWVMKPGQFSNRGNGIQCTNKIQQIRKRVQECVNRVDYRKTRSPLASKSIILQSYITDLLLYNGRKFDIRTYMMVTIVNGKIKAFWYEEGYIRTSSYIWNLSEIEDREVHLTNDAVQKQSDNYGKYEPGNKLSYREIQRYLQANEKASKNVMYEKILPQMKEIANLSLKASYLFLDPSKLQNNFQIFGFDFMLDSKLKPWLIEINTNPCLQLGCPILERIIPNMLENAFRIAIDPLFPPPSQFSYNHKYNIAENAVNYNKFELIFDEDRDGPQVRKLYANRNLEQILTKIEDIQEDKEVFEEDGEEIDLDDQL